MATEELMMELSKSLVADLKRAERETQLSPSIAIQRHRLGIEDGIKRSIKTIDRTYSTLKSKS